MKKVILLFLIALLGTACAIAPFPLRAPKASIGKPLTPDFPVQPQPELATVRVGYFDPFLLHYDPSNWAKRKSEYQSFDNQDVFSLTHLKYGCELRSNVGRGLDENWIKTRYLKHIGDWKFSVVEFNNSNASENILRVYEYSTTDNQQKIVIELSINGHAEDCTEKAEEVIKNSATIDMFGRNQ